MTVTVEQVAGALGSVSEMLQADGYALSVDDVVGDTAHVSVSATPDACADCLAPRAVVAQIMLNDLASVPGVTKVELTYPEGSAAH